MGACRGMCQYATAGTPCDCKCGGTLHGIRAGLHAPLTHAGKLHIDLEHAGQLVMIFDAAAEPTAETTCVPAVDSAAAEEAPMKEVAGGGTTSSHDGNDRAGSDIHDELPGLPHGGDDHHDRRRAVLLDGFRVVPVTREWCEGDAWREWRGWRVDANRGPFYGDTPEDAAVAARRGSLRIVRAA